MEARKREQAKNWAAEQPNPTTLDAADKTTSIHSIHSLFNCRSFLNLFLNLSSPPSLLCIHRILPVATSTLPQTMS